MGVWSCCELCSFVGCVGGGVEIWLYGERRIVGQYDGVRYGMCG